MSNSKEIMDIDHKKRVIEEDSSIRDKIEEKRRKVKKETDELRYYDDDNLFDKNDDEETRAKKELFKVLIDKHVEYCNVANHEKLLKRLGSFMQFQMPYVETRDKHRQVLMPCRRHVYCFECVLELEKESLFDFKKEWSEELEKLHYNHLPSPWNVPPPLKLCLNQDDHEEYPDYEDLNDDTMRHGCVKVSTKEDVLLHCCRHGLPIDRISWVIDKTKKFNVLYFY